MIRITIEGDVVEAGRTILALQQVMMVPDPVLRQKNGVWYCTIETEASIGSTKSQEYYKVTIEQVAALLQGTMLPQHITEDGYEGTGQTFNASKDALDVLYSAWDHQDKVAACKVLRGFTGMGIKEAKGFVENHWAHHR